MSPARADESRGGYSTVAQNEEERVERPRRKTRDLGSSISETNSTFEGDSGPITSIPTAEELRLLPHVSDSLPRGAFLVAIVELCERFAYYGLSGPFQNYISNTYNDKNGLPGALGLRQSSATAITNLFQFWCYITPIFGAVISDQYLGKYVTIKWFSIVYMLGIFILFMTSLPWCIENGLSGPGLMAAMIVIGLGTGGIKSNVSPLIAEQVRSTTPFIKTLDTGKRVVVDNEVTVQRLYMIFYMCINIGSVSAIATTMLELHIGFWAAYFLPLIMFAVGFVVLVKGKAEYVIKPPQGGVIWNCISVLYIASCNGFNIEQAKPSSPVNASRARKMDWSDEFVEELKTALDACKVFLFFPIYWVTYSQMLNNFISQAGQMQLHGLPNDILPNIDPITIIILIPIMDRLIYPFFRTKLHIGLNPITRITLGFLIAALAMIYAFMLQISIYRKPPCFSNPSNCDAAKSEGGNLPNDIHVAWQAPAYVLVALSEILASVTGLELAYAKAPENMKSFIMSLFLLTSAGGSVLGMVIAPFARDPHMHWLYFGLALATAVTGCMFWYTFRSLDKQVTGRNVDIGEYELAQGDSDSDTESEEQRIANARDERALAYVNGYS